MKQRSKAVAEPQPAPVRRERKQGLPKSRRTFISMSSPDIPRPAVDANAPLMGQRKRKKMRRPKLLPNPVSA
jgi:hypothetical protein